MKSQTALQIFLSDPASYPEPTTKVELRETHISKVYLTDQWAFKIKKPLKLAFLDYASLEARHAACDAEIQLNRRFSRMVYMGVVKITQEEDGRFMFEGKGPAVEYAVKMRRIPDACLMDQRLTQKTFMPEDKKRLSVHLVECYRQAPRVPIEPHAYIQRLRGLIAGNQSSLVESSLHLKQDSLPWRAICSKQSLFLQLMRPLLEERVRQGRIIEGHGDLRPEHIVLEDQVSMIDGVEFNRDFRILDLADELSFLVMECAVMGHAELGQELRKLVLDSLQDAVPDELLAFYESYRATVRALVNSLKAGQLPDEARGRVLQRTEAYHTLAEQRLNPVMPPFTFIVCGPMGSGKTTVARALKQELDAEHLESDVMRRQIFEQSPETFGYGQGKYSAESRLKVYEKMRQNMLDLLHQGMNVIVDATFSDPQYANCVLEPLHREGRPYLIVVCECSDEEAMKRISQRMRVGTSPSEARPELYLDQKKKGDWTFQGHPQCRVNTQRSTEEVLHEIYQKARRSLEAQLTY